MLESTVFVMTNSYRPNHRETKGQQVHLGKRAVLKKTKGRDGVGGGTHPRALWAAGLPEAISSRSREVPCLTKQGGEREGQYQYLASTCEPTCSCHTHRLGRERLLRRVGALSASSLTVGIFYDT